MSAQEIAAREYLAGNALGTVEKWYLVAEADGLVYLRKTATPKWNCCMKEFQPEEVYPSYVAAMRARKKVQL